MYVAADRSSVICRKLKMSFLLRIFLVTAQKCVAVELPCTQHIPEYPPWQAINKFQTFTGQFSYQHIVSIHTLNYFFSLLDLFLSSKEACFQVCGY